jgi:hypothetical protein
MSSDTYLAVLIKHRTEHTVKLMGITSDNWYLQRNCELLCRTETAGESCWCISTQCTQELQYTFDNENFGMVICKQEFIMWLITAYH